MTKEKEQGGEKKTELTQLSEGGLHCATSKPGLMAFAAPTLFPTLELDLVPKVSKRFLAEQALGNTKRRWGKRCCNKGAMLKSHGAHTTTLHVSAAHTLVSHAHVLY